MTIEQYFSELSTIDYKFHTEALIIAANAIAMIVITNEKAEILAANSKFEVISEYELSELVGRNHSIVRHPDTPVATFVTMWANLAEGSGYVGKFKNRTKYGKDYWVHASLYPIRNAEGQIYRYIAVKTDLTHEEYIGSELKLVMQQLDTEREARIKAQTKLELSVESVRIISEQLQQQSVRNEEQILYLSRTRWRYIVVTVFAALLGGIFSWLVKHLLDVWLL